MSMLPAIPASGALQSDPQRPPIDRGALGQQLGQELKEAQNARSLYELRWLDDLRQYKGFYPPAVAEQLRKNKRSQVYYRLTTSKVNTMVARLMDLLFPQRSKNWSISPTPDPMLPPDIMAEDMADEINAAMLRALEPVMQDLGARRIVPDMLAMQKLQANAYQQALAEIDTPETRQRVAAERAKRMERLIDDQLKECSANGNLRPAWVQHSRAVVHDACLYGMGILKGPLVEKVQTKRYICRKDALGQLTWKEHLYSEDMRPYHEAVSIWDVFPDPDARNPGELRFVWQSHLMTDKDVIALKSFPGFDAGTIETYLRDHEDGDATLARWESQLRTLDQEHNGGSLKKRYRVWERWGFLTGKELCDAGAHIPEDRHAEVYSSNVWMMGDDTIIKAMVNPLEGVDIPYYWYPYERDDSTFWPEGIASLLRSPQAGINASVRAMQDNVGLSSGPFLAFNMQALCAEDAADLSGAMSRKMLRFERSGVTLPQAFQAVNIPSCIQENLTLQQFWANGADEISTPRFNAGDGNVKGAGSTASGLSMLMGAVHDGRYVAFFEGTNTGLLFHIGRSDVVRLELPAGWKVMALCHHSVDDALYLSAKTPGGSGIWKFEGDTALLPYRWRSRDLFTSALCGMSAARVQGEQCARNPVRMDIFGPDDKRARASLRMTTGKAVRIRPMRSERLWRFELSGTAEIHEARIGGSVEGVEHGV